MSISRVVPDTSATAEIRPSSNPVEVDKETGIEVPYTSYEVDHQRPFVADHYGLGDSHKVFESEIKEIEGYFKDKADHGKIENSTKTIKDLIAKYEKMANIGKEERTSMRVAKLAAFIRFLRETDNLELNQEKYA